jgi:hypothetical protein
MKKKINMEDDLVPIPLNVFTVSPTDTNFLGSTDHEISTVNSIDLKANSSVEFNCLGYGNSVKALNEIFLLCKMQVLKSDETSYTASDTSQPRLSNNVLFSLFSQARLYLNNQLVVAHDTAFSHKEFIETTLNFGESAVMAHLVNQGMYPLTESEKLKGLSANSAIFDVYGKLNLCPTHKLLVPNVGITIKLDFNPINKIIVESSSTSSTIKIHDLKLYIRHYELRDSALFKIETRMLNTPAVYEFQKGQLFAVTIPANVSQMSFPSIFNGLRPSLLLACFLPQKNFVGDKTLDAYQFKPNDVSTFHFLVNQESYPKLPYRMSFTETEKCYSRVFANSYRNLGVRSENDSVLLSKSNFETDLFFIIEDISNHGRALSGLKDPIEFASVGFSVTFSKQLEAPLTALIYKLDISKFTINGGRLVNVVY